MIVGQYHITHSMVNWYTKEGEIILFYYYALALPSYNLTQQRANQDILPSTKTQIVKFKDRSLHKYTLCIQKFIKKKGDI